jgi:enamine deaminase RidA (YjgF/YER057c/UK114 family)
MTRRPGQNFRAVVSRSCGSAAGEECDRVRSDDGVATRSFRGRNGDAEHFISIAVPDQLDVGSQIKQVQDRYTAAREGLGLAPETAVFRRVFVSDVLNQAATVRNSALVKEPAESPVAVSIVEQQPLPGSKVALLAYHVESRTPLVKRRITPKHIVVEKNGLRHLWSTRLCSSDKDQSLSSAAQTRDVFYELIGTLAAQGGTLRDHCVRTWIYVKDVDVFYQGMVDSRRELFAQQGMKGDTHFIASTGIEGACAHRHDIVAMDAYSVLGLAPGQVSFLNDFDRLCATKDYNVTFERGTRVGYADRAHHFISGTASIDNAGWVVHPGNVLRQLDRALENVGALLQSGQARLEDMHYLIVYLRDPTDYGRVESYLAERFPGLPLVIVEGAVCRPEWLIEVEGVGIAADTQPDLPEF